MQKMQPKTSYEILQKFTCKQKVSMKQIIPSNSQLMTAKFGYEDQLVAAGYSDGKVKIFNVNTNKKLHQINTCVESKQTGPINTLKWRPPSHSGQSIGSVLLVANSNGNLYQYIGKNGKQIFHTKQQGNFIMSLDYKNDGSSFATAGKDNIIRIYDEQTKKIQTQLKSIQWNKSGHSNRIFCVKFNKEDSNMILSGGWDQNIYIWDLRTAQTVKRLNGPKIGGECIDIQQDIVLTGANRSTEQIQLWSLKQQKVISNFKWDGDAKQTGASIFSCSFSRFDKNIILAAGGNQMKLYSIDKKDGPLVTIQVSQQDNLYTCDSSINKPKYVTGGKQGNLFYFIRKQE